MAKKTSKAANVAASENVSKIPATRKAKNKGQVGSMAFGVGDKVAVWTVGPNGPQAFEGLLESLNNGGFVVLTGYAPPLNRVIAIEISRVFYVVQNP